MKKYNNDTLDSILEYYSQFEQHSDFDFDLFSQIAYYKSGSKIHVKEKNRGKFTKSAKAAGRSVQEHARAVLNDPNATPLQKKRANFARNAAKWKK